MLHSAEPLFIDVKLSGRNRKRHSFEDVAGKEDGGPWSGPVSVVRRRVGLIFDMTLLSEGQQSPCRDLRRVADLGATSQALGHSDLSTTASIYGHHDLSDLERAMEALAKVRRSEEEEPAD